jgi:hypothetical protein
MDKIDGPYYFFKAIQKTRHALPEWFPLVGIEVGKTNIVPVDYVAAAMDHIAHLPDLDGQAFHLVDPKMTRAGDVINTFAQAGHAPKMVVRVDKRMTDMLPKGVLSYAMKLPALKDIRRSVLADLGIPDSIIEYIGLKPTFDARDTRRALAPPSPARGSSCRRWSPTPTSCGTTGSATSTRTSSRTARSSTRSTARR